LHGLTPFAPPHEGGPGEAERGVLAIAHQRDAPKDGQRLGRWRECAVTFEASARDRPRKITDFLDFRICRCRREFRRPVVPIRTRCIHFFAKARYTIYRGSCARGSPTLARGPSGNRSARSGHHRVSTGANPDARQASGNRSDRSSSHRRPAATPWSVPPPTGPTRFGTGPNSFLVLGIGDEPPPKHCQA
jgi:hypothetical protein